MFRFLRKHQKILFTFVAICIVVVIFFGIGTNAIMHSPFDSILKVNGAKINQAQFDQIYNQIIRQHPATSPEIANQVMGQTMNEVIRQEVFDQEAKKYGIQVPDQEVMLTITGTPAFQNKEGKFDLSTYAQTLAQVVGMSPADFEKAKKKEIAARKINQLIASSIHVSDEAVESALKNRLATEKDSKKRKELIENPGIVADELQNQELNWVFNDWLTQINSQLKVEIISEPFKKRLSGTPS